MATSEPRRVKLSQECERIEEDCDCGRKTMWNERDALISRVNTLQHISTSIKALQTALGTGALLQAIKGLNLGECPLASVTVVSLPLLYVVEALLKTDFHRSWGEKCHNLGSEYDTLWVQTRENRLPYCELDDATAHHKILLILLFKPLFLILFCGTIWRSTLINTLIFAEFFIN